MKTLEDLFRRYLYGSVSVLLMLLTTAAAGPGIVGWEMAGVYTAFDMVCHQLPQRAILVSGYPMAVCSRCFGIYFGLTAGWLLIPLIRKTGTGISARKSIWFFSLAVSFNVVDWIGSATGFWQNTPASRYLLGLMIGIALVSVVMNNVATLEYQYQFQTDNHGHRDYST